MGSHSKIKLQKNPTQLRLKMNKLILGLLVASVFIGAVTAFDEGDCDDFFNKIPGVFGLKKEVKKIFDKVRECAGCEDSDSGEPCLPNSESFSAATQCTKKFFKQIGPKALFKEIKKFFKRFFGTDGNLWTEVTNEALECNRD